MTHPDGTSVGREEDIEDDRTPPLAAATAADIAAGSPEREDVSRELTEEGVGTPGGNGGRRACCPFWLTPGWAPEAVGPAALLLIAPARKLGAARKEML